MTPIWLGRWPAYRPSRGWPSPITIWPVCPMPRWPPFSAAAAPPPAAPPPTASPPCGAPTARPPPERTNSVLTHDDMIRDLSSAYQPNRDDLDGLHTRLAAAANDAGILDVAYTTMETPVGTLLLAATGSRPDSGRLRQRGPRHRSAGVVRPHQRPDTAGPEPAGPRGQATRRVFRRPPAPVRPPARLAPLCGVPPQRARAAGSDRLRADRHLRLTRRPRRPPEGRAGRGYCLRHQSVANRGPVPSGAALPTALSAATAEESKPSAPC